LKDLTDIKDAIATPFEHLDPVIEPLNEATAKPFKKVVRDLVEPSLYGSQEVVKRRNVAVSHPLTPGLIY
jgi:hypothetical protein